MEQPSKKSQQNSKAMENPSADTYLNEIESDSKLDSDQLLKEVAPDIEEELQHLGNEFSGITENFEPLELYGDLTSGDKVSFSDKLKSIKKRINLKILNILNGVFYRFKYFFIWLALEGPKRLIQKLKSLLKGIKAFISVYKKWTRSRKILFYLSITVLGCVSYLYYIMIKDKVLYQENFKFYGSMAELADYSFTFDTKKIQEPFYNSPRVKSYSFQMKPIVVNLRRENSENENPMGFFEFVFEGNSSNVVVEFKDRESEFVDLAGRVVEGLTYESLDTVEGKAELKENLKKELNKKLTEGTIRRVEIRNFFIKP